MESLTSTTCIKDKLSLHICLFEFYSGVDVFFLFSGDTQRSSQVE